MRQTDAKLDEVKAKCNYLNIGKSTDGPRCAVCISEDEYTK